MSALETASELKPAKNVLEHKKPLVFIDKLARLCCFVREMVHISYTVLDVSETRGKHPISMTGHVI